MYSWLHILALVLLMALLGNCLLAVHVAALISTPNEITRTCLMSWYSWVMALSTLNDITRYLLSIHPHYYCL